MNNTMKNSINPGFYQSSNLNPNLNLKSVTVPIEKNSSNTIIIIIIFTILLLILLGGGLGYYFYKKKTENSSSSQQQSKPQIINIPVNIDIKGGLVSNSSTTITNTILSGLSVFRFLDRYTKPGDINRSFTSITINNIPVDLSSGRLISKMSITKMYDFLGITTPPESIDLNIIFNWVCLDTRPNCNPCKAEELICTSDGWKCVEKKKCPTSRNDLKDCCNDITDKINKYATCNETTKIVNCGPCPEPKKDCAAIDPFSSAICTGTGWVCAPGTVCPPDLSSYNNLCSGGKKFYCQIDENGKAATGCADCNPSIKPSCGEFDGKKLCGSICVNGSWVCKQGIADPITESVKKAICNDPEKPFYKGPNRTSPAYLNKSLQEYPNCSSNFVVDYNAQCSDCGDKPKPGDSNYDTKCALGSCMGHDYVCTVNGWSCQPNKAVNPPSDNIFNTCCERGYMPYWDSNSKCIKCRCPEGRNFCPAGGTGICGDKGLTKCCIAGECKKEPKFPDISSCCNTELCSPTRDKAETSPVCCPVGTACNKDKGVCGARCGGLICDEGEVCIKIENVVGDNLNWFVNKKKEPGQFDKIEIEGSTVRFCKPKSGCEVSLQYTIPSSISNFYPCRPFRTNPTTGRLGYCNAKDTMDNKYCYDSNCSDTKKCEWRDILNYMGSPTGTVKYNSGTGTSTISLGLIDKVREIDYDLRTSTQNLGNYCKNINDNNAFGRIIAHSITGPTCDWQTCWTIMAKPGIKSIEYNDTTKNCIGIQACGEGGDVPKMQSYEVTKNGEFAQPPILKNDNVNVKSDFNNCNPPDYCPIETDLQPIYKCLGDTIQTNRVNTSPTGVKTMPDVGSCTNGAWCYNVTNLEPLSVDCGPNSVLNKFRFRRDPIEDDNAKGIMYEYTCSRGGQYASPITRTTQWIDSPNRSLLDLTKFNLNSTEGVQCQPNELLNQFKLEKGSGTNTGKIRYNYTCLPINNPGTKIQRVSPDGSITPIDKYASAYTVYTPASDNLILLDKQAGIDCGDSNFTGFNLERLGTDKNIRYAWNCGKEVPR